MATVTSMSAESLTKAPEQPRRERLAWVLLLVVSAAIAPYLGTLRFSFVYDDNVQALGLQAIRAWTAVPAYFFKPVPGVVVRYYRPLFFLWFRLNYFLWGPHAWGWHLANVTLHAAVTVLVFFLLSKYFRDVHSAVAGALVFGVHPAHIETVAWISGCTDSLMAIGILGSLLLWMRNSQRSTIKHRLGSLLCCALALLAKETAIILPLLVGLHALIGSPPSSNQPGTAGDRLRFAFQETLPYAGITAAYVGVRAWVLSTVAGTPNWISHTKSLLTIPSIFLFYVKHLCWPLGLSIFYDFTVVDRLWSYRFWLPLLALVTAAGGAWFCFERSKDVRIFVASSWIMLPLAPVVYIRVFQPDEFLHDRYLYLAVIGLSVLAGWLIEFLWKKELGGLPSFLLAVGGFVVLCLGLATALQAESWKTNLTLYTHAMQLAPNSMMSRNNLASEYAAEGRYQEANTILEALLADHPGMWLANYNYGYVNYRIGNLPLAEQYLRRAIQIDAKDSYQYLFLGTSYFKEGRLSEASEQLRQAIARQPDGGGYHFTLGMIELRQGNVAAARAEMQEELKYHPENGSRVAQAEAMIDQPTKSSQ